MSGSMGAGLEPGSIRVVLDLVDTKVEMTGMTQVTGSMGNES